jgi:hypothetical protein
MKSQGSRGENMSASRASVPRPSSSRLVSSQTAGWERISIRVSCPGTMAGALIRPIKRGWDGGFIEAHLFRAAACSFFESGPRIPRAAREVNAGTVLSPREIFGSSVFKRFNTDTLLEIATPRKTNFVAVCDATRPAGRLPVEANPNSERASCYRLEYAEMTRLRWFEHCMLSWSGVF